MTTSAPKRWLSLIGIGEDGLNGLTPAARRLIAQADLTMGGARHLALVEADPAKSRVWPSPITDAMPQILAARGKNVVVLASGDPFFFGVGTMLVDAIPMAEILCIPQPSSFALAAARLGWTVQNCILMSLHGHALPKIVPQLRPKAQLMVLSWDGETPAQIADDLVMRGMGRSRVVALCSMGGPKEARYEALAKDWPRQKIDPLNVVAIEIVADKDARIIQATPGIPDVMFEHDGQMTKREVRAITLSALAPMGNEILWDIGAGSGSVSIEWLLAAPRNQAFAIEANMQRVARMGRNALALGAPDIQIIEGKAPDILKGLPQPDAVFIGGGATAPGLMHRVKTALRPGGRLVVNGVALETQALLTQQYKEDGGELISIQIGHAALMGNFSSIKPASPVVQWRWIKP